jgi:hypothetical protein
MSSGVAIGLDAIGDVTTRIDIEHNTLQHVQNWLVYMLARLEEKDGLLPQTLAVPRSWRVLDAFVRMPEDVFPFVDVISPGTARGIKPQIDGDGEVRAWWSVAVGAAVSANSEQAAKDLAGYYGTAIRLLMQQMPDLGGWAYGCDWNGEIYDDLPAADERTIATARELFTVEVHGVLQLYSGPPFPSDQPPDDPYTPPPEVPFVGGSANIFIDVENVGIEDPLPNEDPLLTEGPQPIGG